MVMSTIEPAKSSRASCKVCKDKIEIKSARLGIENEFNLNGEIVKSIKWYHIECGAKKFPKEFKNAELNTATITRSGRIELSKEDIDQILDIKSNLNRYKIIVTKSTVPVTTGDKITKILKSNKNKNKFDVVSNPEFLREGEAIRDFQFPDRVVVGTSSNKANKIMKKLYLPLIKKGGRYFHTSRRSAELIKYASNAFLATKITFINEIANLCEKSNIDVKEVAIGMGLDERIGSRFLRAGPAYGGSCFPKDTRALVSTGRMFKTNLSVVKSVINSNDKRTNLLLNKISKIMNNKIKNKNITFLGVTFKPGTDDMRESSSLKMIPSLIRKGAHVNYYEPTGKKKELKSKNINFFENIKDACKSADLIIIHTEWNEFKQLNFKKITKKRNFKVFDMRNLYSTSEMKKNKINYFSIGR